MDIGQQLMTPSNTQFDPNVLFADDGEAPSRASGRSEDEFGMIRDGRKAMAVYTFPYAQKFEGEEKEISNAALSMGLTVSRETFTNPLGPPNTNLIFVARPEQTWRFDVYMKLQKVLYEYGWSNGAEYLESYILGYSADETTAWMERTIERRLSWKGTTTYILLPEDSIDKIDALGRRAFPPGEIEYTLFFSRSYRRLKKDALGRVPSGMTVARVALENKFFNRIFRNALSTTDDIVSCRIAVDEGKIINASVVSKIEILTKDRWR